LRTGITIETVSEDTAASDTAHLVVPLARQLGRDQIPGGPFGGLVGQRHFGLFRPEDKHDAQASEFRRYLFTRLRFVLVLLTKVALSN
jgi:hypothetical protein